MAKKAGFPDLAQGAGVLQALITELLGLTGDNDAHLQGVDRMDGGVPWHLQSFGPSATLLVRSATVPSWMPLVFKVPTGKFFVPDKILVEATGTADWTAQLSRRYLLAGNCATANPGAPSAPTVALVTHDAGNPDANGVNTFDYKITQMNALGQETVASAASSTLTPGTTQKAIDITIPALATGAVAVGIYRRMNAGAWEFLSESRGGVTFRDTRPQSDMDATRTAPGVATWGNAFTGEEAPGPCQLIYACLNALSAAPARIVYKDDSGKRDNVAFAPATTAGTFVRIPLANQETTGEWATPAAAASYQTQDARITDYGAVAVYGFNNTFANMGGQWVIWGSSLSWRSWRRPLLSRAPGTLTPWNGAPRFPLGLHSVSRSPTRSARRPRRRSRTSRSSAGCITARLRK